jgi:hypothetical protein
MSITGITQCKILSRSAIQLLGQLRWAISSSNAHDIKLNQDDINPSILSLEINKVKYSHEDMHPSQCMLVLMRCQTAMPVVDK